MTDCTLGYVLNGETLYLVLLEFPLEDQKDENLPWLGAFRSEVEEFCDEHCFKVGDLHILPRPYFSVVESFLKKARREYKGRGYRTTFKFLKASLAGRDYLDLQTLILDRIQWRLEICLSRLESEELNDGLLSDALREVTKANESILIFQLSKAFPRETTRVYDLISILNEKISEFRIHKSKEVVVTEL